MAYLALARKWRPKTFSEVVGQSHVVKALTNALESGRVHHAFLFTGTRGVGKTTLARIFSKSLNCEEGTSAEPCQQCNTCRSIDEGRYIDLIEIDAASRTKVDDTRELLDSVQYAPTSGKYKVYLIDEVHMLSGHSFNALLKTLEEPPEHVKFLFATTDPQKLPVTVISRCLQFNLRALRPEQIQSQLVKIIDSESMPYDLPALTAIAKAADGSMRDGLSLLDQAIAQGGGEVRIGEINAMLGTINAEHTAKLMQALAHSNAEQIMQVIAAMAEDAVDFEMAMDELLMQLYYASLEQLMPNQNEAIVSDMELTQELAAQFNAEKLQLFYQIGLISKRDIALAPSLRIGFEMAMLRMLAFEPVEDSGRTKRSTTPTPTPTPTAVQNVANQQASVQAVPVVTIEASSVTAESVAQVPTSAPETASEQIKSQVAVQQASAVQTAAHEQPSVNALTLAGNNEWGELVEQTKLDGMSKELAMNCACEKMTPEKIHLSLSPRNKHILNDSRLAELESALQTQMPSLKNIEVEVEESDKETPAECLTRLGYEQQQETEKNLLNDPIVKSVMNEFGATINPSSIQSN